MIDYSKVKNEQIKADQFLQALYDDPYFPDQAVVKVEAVLRDLCVDIERENPATLDDLYLLTCAATDKVNDLQDDFLEADSQIETFAREVICEAFDVIANAYGFDDADSEELTASRDWWKFKIKSYLHLKPLT